jgi:hypothetical protein
MNKEGDWIGMNAGTQGATNIRMAKILRNYYEWRGHTYQDLLWVVADNSPHIKPGVSIERKRVKTNPKFESDIINPPTEEWMFRAVMKILFDVPSNNVEWNDTLSTYHHTTF